MDKLKYIKLENEDGSYSESIPLAVDADHVDVNGSTLTRELNNKATKEEVQAVASGSPAGVYATVAALTTADPDHSKIYVVSADGHWYYYNSGWQDGGVYQSPISLGVSNYILQNNGSIIIDNNDIIISGYVFILGTGRIKIQAGTYTLSNANQLLVCNNNGIVSIKSSTDNDISNYYIIAIRDDINGILLNYNGFIKSEIENLDKILNNAIPNSQFIIFTTPGFYDNSGNIITNLGAFKCAEILISKPGLYRVGWYFYGEVSYIHAVNNNNEIIYSWQAGTVNKDFIIDIPIGTVKLLASAGANFNDTTRYIKIGTQKYPIGYLTYIEDISKAEFGYTSENQINQLINSKIVDIDDRVKSYITIQGNPYSDGKWHNSQQTGTYCEIYSIEEGAYYDLYYDPSFSYQVAMSSVHFSEQLNEYANFYPVTYDNKIINPLGNDVDVVTINEENIKRKTITNFQFPNTVKSLMIVTKLTGKKYDSVRLYKRSQAKGIYNYNDNKNKKIVILGDSVSQQKASEIGKEKIRNLLNCRVDTFGVGGSGWAINSYAYWSFSHNTSGIYQIEELVKNDAELYDIYLLSCTLNDPITFNKDIGDYNYCKPYLKNNNLPDLTDPHLDTMLGGLNYAIQRIYEKNPKAKIILGTMNKCFLNNPTSGFDTEAGWNPLDSSVNSHNHTYYDYVSAVRQLGEIWNIPVVDIYSESGINNFNKDEYMDDQYHPNENGYKIIWNLWLEKIVNS